MAWQVSKRVWDHTKVKVKEDKEKFRLPHRLILLALADIADEHGICWPRFDTSYQTLADMTGIDRRSAIRVISDLIEAGCLLKVDAVGRGHSNIYAVIIGLTRPEVESILALIGDSHVTIYKEETGKKPEELVSPMSPIKTELVTAMSPPSDMAVTISPLNGDSHVTHPIMFPSSYPNGVGDKPPGEPKKRDGPRWELMNEFIALTGISIPVDKPGQKYWWNQIGVIYGIVKQDVKTGKKLMKEAFERLGRENVYDPGSLVKTIRQAMASKPKVRLT